ncbi:MAG: fumarate/nitrate reduction transcriptional regulator Fnr [Pseudomonadales bacterium]|nr:fumarate/nitrate reduction transcriptional regulator Fnr [Pseudomonadales bacterium]
MSTSNSQAAPCVHGFVSASCSDCNLKGLCLPIAMDIKDIDRLDRIIQRNRLIQGGEHLYHSDDSFTAIYAVRSGSLKTYMINAEGVEQVIGFCLPGEILGLDGVGNDAHDCHVVAMETSSICEIPFARLEELSRQIPSLQRHFFQLMGQQIKSDHQMMLTLSKKNADGRLATLLVSLSRRYSRRKLSASAMHLPMSRNDIGNFLGLTIETVSRTFSRLQKEGIIDVSGREILIKDHERLNALCQNSR